jgi:hypothetical protein
MALTVGITSITKTANKWNVEFNDGMVYHFSGLADVKEWIKDFDHPEIAKRIAMAYWIAKNPDGSNPASLVGKTMTFDLTNANPIRVA